jgi:hypothetical protein
MTSALAYQKLRIEFFWNSSLPFNREYRTQMRVCERAEALLFAH